MDSIVTQVRVSSCCEYVSLQTGSIIIGILYFVCGIVLVITASVIFQYPCMIPFSDQMVTHWDTKYVIGGFLGYLFVELIVSALLIIGAVKRKENYVLPSVCMGFVNILGCLGISIGYLTLISNYLTATIIEMILGFMLIKFPLQLYLWRVILSFYKELVADNYGCVTYYDSQLTYVKSLANDKLKY